jgi:tripartite-type tricarboxylate transporter receptor subunit TctC
MELFLVMTGTRMLHVPYKGPTPGMLDLLAGRVAVMPLSAPPSLPQVRAGRLRALGVTSARRMSAAPDIPTIAEAGVPGYDASQWYGMLAPAGTPPAVIDRLQRELAAVLALPEARERLAAEGAEVVAGSPQAFRDFIGSELEKWRRVVKSAGITPE